MPAEWQIALAVLCGFLSGALCTYLACRITEQGAGDRGQGTEETVGADADGQASGAPQGRPQPTDQATGGRRQATGDRAARARGQVAMALSERICWFVDCNTYGGILHERLLAAIVRDADQGLYSGLVFSFSSAGQPTIAYWDRIDDLERGGFAPISAARARAMCDALPAFLERLEHVQSASACAAGSESDG